jgi:hypothetical protein
VRKLVVTKKTGFTINDPSKPLIIRDNRGLLFYSTEQLLPNKKITCFNMPGFGNFWIETGGVSARIAPIHYPYAELPELQRRENPITKEEFPDPFNFDVQFGNNPNKCTIKWSEHVIFFDNQFKEKPLPQVFFILGHEYAHTFFESETLCDQMAGNYMKDLGFNPSQIGAAPILALSEKQYQRKVNMVESLINA